MANISVIVPCYNSEKFISATVESIKNQSISDWELILIDDGSTDRTMEIITEFALHDSRIKSYHKENGGTSKSRNFGYSKADPSSKYLFFLDHDDQLVSTALSTLSLYLDNHPDIGLVGCQYCDVNENGIQLSTGKRSRWAPGRFFPRELTDKEIETPFVTFFCATGQGPFALYRRSVYIKTTGWETDFWPHEDTDIFCQMALLSKVHFLPDRLYLKRIHPAQGMNNWHRVQNAYVAFRNKWDNLKGENTYQTRTLIHAKRYYYSVHQPFRYLKIAKSAFKELVRKPSFKALKWFFHLVKTALAGFLSSPFKPYK